MAIDELKLALLLLLVFCVCSSLAEAEIPVLTAKAEAVTKEKQAFERIVLSKDDALKMFADNPFKVQLISTKIPDGGYTTAYRCGPLIDLCRGPHVPTTASIKAFEVLRASASYWLGNAQNDSLQRVYGISFPDAKQLKQYKHMVEEAKKRDHRVLGTKQDLFFFHELSPGSCFFMPHGARIYNKLMEFIRGEYRKRGYDEVITPNMFNIDLWRISGHAGEQRNPRAAESSIPLAFVFLLASCFHDTPYLLVFPSLQTTTLRTCSPSTSRGRTSASSP